MPSDPLSRPLDDWNQTDLDQLVGRSESEYLELKGSKTDIRSNGRQVVAKAIAGMVSASGGYVVIGTEAGKDGVTAYPGIEVTGADVENFLRSLHDLIRPSDWRSQLDSRCGDLRAHSSREVCESAGRTKLRSSRLGTCSPPFHHTDRRAGSG